MAYVWQRWIAEALEHEGCRVQVVDGWKDRGRYRSDGRNTGIPSWDFTADLGFAWHHTGTTTSRDNPWPTAQTLIQGRSDLPGPLCQISVDYNGIVHVVAAGRANHAGKTNGFSHLPEDSDGNTHLIGCEIDYDGTQSMSRAQYNASIRAAAAYCRYKKRDYSYAYGHHETSVTGKWDPGLAGRAMNMDIMRRSLRECLLYPPGVWRNGPAASWGVVRVSHLRSSYGHRSSSIKKLQYRLKNMRRMPQRLQDPIKVNGVYDDATIAAVEHFQDNVFSGGSRRDFHGRNMTNAQAKELFGRRYRLIEE